MIGKIKKMPAYAEYIIIFLGAMLTAFTIKNIYDPHNLVTGGVSGLSVILKETLHIPLWLTNTLFNIPLFIISARVHGWRFIRKTLFATLSISLGLAIVPEVTVIGDDLLLSSIFGGALSGLGVGIVFLFQATTGGTDMLASLIRMKFKHMSLVQLLLYIDGLIVLLGISVFGINKALYGIMTVFVFTKISGNLTEGINFAKQVFIISDYSELIADKVMHEMDRGVTGVKAIGMYSKTDKNMLFCIVSIKEVVKLKEIVSKIDENAFVIVSDAREVLGEGFVEK